MPHYRWVPSKPHDAVTRVLNAAKWTLSASPQAVTVCASTTVPSASASPFVWVVPRKPDAAAMHQALNHGAYDVIDLAEANWEKRLLARMHELLTVEPELVPPPTFVAESLAAKTLLRKLFQASQTSMPVLLTGETGTGKEVSARVIHQWSNRKSRAMVPINCAGIPNELMEGELFGYTKGAFSGAIRDYDGLVSAAEGGTVFLDEIDDTPHSLQMKLLRVLEDHVVFRLGDSAARSVNFRVLAATNRNLLPLIERGEFGADLYERLATVMIELPPLRERVEDIHPLSLRLIELYYADDAGAQKRHRVHSISQEALEVLRGYHWPGNIRELRNVISGSLVYKRAGDSLLASDLPKRLWAPQSRTTPVSFGAQEMESRMASGTMNLKADLESLERQALTIALRRAHGNAAHAARLLGEVGRGTSRSPGDTVRTMMKRLGIQAS